jgi:hypothetical protein
MALGSTQPLTEMSTRNLPGGKRRPGCKAENLTALCELIVWKMWEPRRLTTLWACTACCRDCLNFFLPSLHYIPAQFVRWRDFIFHSHQLKAMLPFVLGSPEFIFKYPVYNISKYNSHALILTRDSKLPI